MQTKESSISLQKMFVAAQSAQQTGLLKQAQKLYEDILKYSPQSAEVHQALAILLVRTAQPSQAIQHFQIVANINPSHAPSHANLASALAEAGRTEDAITEFKLALNLDPNLTQAEMSLAANLRKLKKTDEAITHYEAVLEKDHNNYAALNGLGLAYRDLGDRIAALDYLEKAVYKAPRNPDFRFNFGVTLLQHQLYTWAVEQFIEAINLRPEWLEAIVLLAETLQEQRRFDEALECYQRAIALRSDSLELIERRAYVYIDMNDDHRAIIDFNNVLEKNPKRTLALMGLGLAHMDFGRSKDAALSFERLIEIYPEYDAAYLALAQTKRFTTGDPLINKLKKIEQQSNNSEDLTICVNFALGKIFNDCKDWEQAFLHYAKGNAKRKQQLEYQPHLLEDHVDSLIKFFNRDFFDQHQSLAVQSTLPVVIVGMPRSGTTLTEQIISSHPSAIGAGEVSFWNRSPTAMPYLADTDSPYPECLVKLIPEAARAVVNKYLMTLNNIVGVKEVPLRITDKMPHNFLNIGLIALLMPEVPIIHVKRNVMDNCLSIFFQNFKKGHNYAYDLSDIGHQYKQYEKLMAHWHNVLPGKIMDINYEDTVNDPEYWSRKLIDHVGLEWDEACLAPHKLERSVKTASHWQVRQPIYKTSVKRWKHYEKYLGPLKEALGYVD